MFKRWIALLICAVLLMTAAPCALAYSYQDIFVPQSYVQAHNANIHELLTMLFPNAPTETVAQLNEMMQLSLNEAITEGRGGIGVTSANQAITIYYQAADPAAVADNVTLMVPEDVAQTYLVIYLNMIGALDSDCNSSELVQWLVNSDAEQLMMPNFHMSRTEWEGYKGLILEPRK